MKRLLGILVFLCLSLTMFGQEETRVVDSLLNIMGKQQGREKVKTMIELTWEFYDVSYDECLDWGEKAIQEAQRLDFAELEADATYALGMQYGYHADLDLAQVYLKKAFDLHKAVGNENRAFEDLWNQAYFEQVLGNMDSSFLVYEKVLSFAEQRNDTFAMANTYANMAVIRYQIHDFEHSETYFKKCRSLYVSLDNKLEEARADANLANLYMEWGKFAESRKLYQKAISEFESLERYDFLLMVYKNYGQLFEKEYVKYDSASYYFEKAMACVDQVERRTGSLEEVVNAKADLMVEMGNTYYNKNNYKEAEDYYIQAYDLAESSSYVSGQMLACVGLGLVYSYLAMPTKSLYYLNLFFELKAKSGISIAFSTMRFPLILNYARLGKFDELESELKDFKEEYEGLLRENNDLYDQINSLQDETQWLRSKYETQNNKIETLQAQRNHYRLAFFGLLAIALFVVVLFVAYKIVRKKRTKV